MPVDDEGETPPPDSRYGERDFHGIGRTYSKLILHVSKRAGPGPSRPSPESLVGGHQLIAFERHDAIAHLTDAVLGQQVSTVQD